MYQRNKEDLASYFLCNTLIMDVDTAAAAIGVYAFTGVDTVDAFFGCGKIAVWKRPMKLNEASYWKAMQQLGKENELSEKLFVQLELFTLRVVYNDPVSKDLAAGRARKWRQSNKQDTTRLPPDPDSFRQHCLRAHLQVKFTVYL